MEEKKTKNIHLKSHAKINLFLDVISKRKDNFHKIKTIFSEIDIFDELNFILTERDNIEISTNIDSLSNKENLIYKTALFIQKKYNVKNGVKIELKKIIPVSAGLGGGSSNAAQTIKALSELWQLHLTSDEMNEIAGQFGSDINFFLHGGTALGEGKGDRISILNDIPIENIFLVNPGFGISSREAYEAVKISKTRNSNWKNLLKEKDVKYCYNDLEKGVSKRYPEIYEIINYLENNGASKSMLSGSGATIIGFCPDRKTTEEFQKYYSKKNYWNCVTKTIRRSK